MSGEGRASPTVRQPSPAGLPLVRVSGRTPYERGREHGEQARDRIDVSIATYERMFRDFVGLGWDKACAIGMQHAGSIADHAPDLLDELAGIADGSQRELRDILALNARSEIALSDRAAADGCTAIAAVTPATAGDETLLAQNWDWRRAQGDALIVLIVEEPGVPQIAMVTEAGIVGKIGMNSLGLGVCLNALVSTRSAGSGIPLHIALRLVLQSESLPTALDVVTSIEVSASGNLVVAQPGLSPVAAEIGPEGMHLHEAVRGMVAHTNHFLDGCGGEHADLGDVVFPDTRRRLARAHRLLHEREGRIDVAAAMAILRDHAGHPSSICRHEDPELPEGRRIASVFSIVMDLRRRTMFVAKGAPCSSDYVEIELDPLWT